ncbi:MAG: hypothetical protein CSB55_02795 [Candidatus Cloacimonadota bacterium]|nr:MAG: hypothetical protein CSB55_02795 [Candidatus Cloacimonadota bacterium]
MNQFNEEVKKRFLERKSNKRNTWSDFLRKFLLLSALLAVIGLLNNGGLEQLNFFSSSSVQNSSVKN